MSKLFILDASGYLYRSYFAIRNITNAKGQSTNALYGFIRSVLKLFKDFSPQYVVAVFDGPNNGKSRQSIYSDYKAHRLDMPSDLYYQIEWARTFCETIGIPYLNIPNVEADDTMGSVATWAADLGHEVFVCTSDKDLCQVVSDKVFILNTFKENLILRPKEVQEAFGVPPNLIVDLLSITGDTSDNIPGMKGIGLKTAASLLNEFGSLDNLLQNVDQLKGKKQEIVKNEAENALLSRKLVTINKDVSFPKDFTFFELKKPHTADLKGFYSSMNFNSLLREVEEDLNQETNQSEEVVSYRLVNDESELDELIALLSKQKEICFDTETTDLHPLKAKLVGMAFCYEPFNAWYVPLNGNILAETVLKKLKPLFEDTSLSFYGHNLKYDYHVLLSHGISVASPTFDSIIASYLLNSHSRQHSLDTLALEYFGKIKIPIENLIGKGKSQISMEQVPLDKVCEYACEDVDYTCRLKQILEKQLIERNLISLFNTLEMPLLPVLANMERKGIFIDVPYIKNFSKDLSNQINLLQKEIFEIAGEEFNLNSPKQLTEILTNRLGIKLPKKTATGFSTNADVLESLKKDYPICAKLLDYRTVEKLRSTYVDSLPNEVLPSTGRIHCTFNQSVTATGRLSCQNPNLQNIPVRSEIGRKIREAFKPQLDDWHFLAADYSQVELRLLAHLSEDPHLLTAFNNNEDIHTFTASLIFGIPLNQVTSDMRYQAKAVNFGIIYGQQAFGLSEQLGVDVKEAALFIDTYFKRYPRVKEFMEDCKSQARKTGKAVTLYGRERAIPEINSKNGIIRGLAERLAVNTPIQGTAADLIKKAMLNIHSLLQTNNFKSFMLLQIHDELIFEVPEVELKDMEILVKKTMQGVEVLKVPLIVDINVGKNWKEC